MLNFSLSGNQWFDQLSHPILLTQNCILVYWNPSAQTAFEGAEWLKEGASLPTAFADSANSVLALTLCGQAWEIHTQTVQDGLLYELFPLADADSAFSRQRLSQLALQMQTMLNPIFASVDLLQRSLDEKEQSKSSRSLCYMNHNLHKLLRLTDHLAFFSQTEENLLYAYPPATCDLSALCKELQTTLQWTAEKANRQFVYQSNTDNALVAINESLFRKLLYNLVSNAFRAGGNITMKLDCKPHRKPQQVVITLKDTGRGFSSEQLSALFAPSAERPTTTTLSEGFALGLPICRRIATLYKGTLLVSARSTGSEITLSFPLCKPSHSMRLSASTIFYSEDLLNQVLIELSDVLPFECYHKDEME